MLRKPLAFLIAAFLLTAQCFEYAEAVQKDFSYWRNQTDIAPDVYQRLLGQGMDVDWGKTKAGEHAYSSDVPKMFSSAGIDHVRIRVKDAFSNALAQRIAGIVSDCLDAGMIPIVAYQADDFKNNPNQEERARAVNWWRQMAAYLQNTSALVSFDLLIECTDALNKDQTALNVYFEDAVTEIRKTNPTRIVFISPRVRSAPEYLSELAIPSGHNDRLMVEWHFYASGPSKTNDKKLWTVGNRSERALIEQKIQYALDFQQKTGLKTWVGAWMAGNYNEGNDYTIEEQTAFASFVVGELQEAKIPFAINSDTHFFDRENCAWIKEKQPILQAVFGKK